jgi:hypothetical protein
MRQQRLTAAGDWYFLPERSNLNASLCRGQQPSRPLYSKCCILVQLASVYRHFMTRYSCNGMHARADSGPGSIMSIMQRCSCCLLLLKLVP